MSSQDQNDDKTPSGAIVLVNTLALPSLRRMQELPEFRPEFGPLRLHIVFNTSWAEPLAISEELSGYRREARADVSANVLTLAMDTSQALSPSIEVRSLGEYLEPVLYVYELANRTSLVARPFGSLCMDSDDSSLALSSDSPETFLFGPREYLDALALLLEDTEDTRPSPKRDAQRFFSELDRKAEARLRDVGIPAEERIPTRNHMTGLFYALEGRFRERYGKASHAPYSQRANVRADVEHVSGMMLGLARSHFPDGSGGISPKRFAEAFEMFANGELRLQVPPYGVWSNQPSSGYYFYFAELALLAIECRVDVETWRPLLNVLVRTQEIYCTAYAPAMPRTDRQLWDYKACNFSESKQVDESGKVDLRTSYASLTTPEDLSRRSGKNAKEFVGAFRP